MAKRRIIITALAAIAALLAFAILLIGARKRSPGGNGLTFVKEAQHGIQI